MWVCLQVWPQLIGPSWRWQSLLDSLLSTEFFLKNKKAFEEGFEKLLSFKEVIVFVQGIGCVVFWYWIIVTEERLAKSP